MNTRLEQQAADALHAFERQQRWRDRVKADWRRAQPGPMGSSWTPTITEQEARERKQQVAAGNLPF